MIMPSILLPFKPHTGRTLATRLEGVLARVEAAGGVASAEDGALEADLRQRLRAGGKCAMLCCLMLCVYSLRDIPDLPATMRDLPSFHLVAHSQATRWKSSCRLARRWAQRPLRGPAAEQGGAGRVVGAWW